jgi:hypothetical protein
VFPGIQVPLLAGELFANGVHRLGTQSQAERRFRRGDHLDDGGRDQERVVGLASRQPFKPFQGLADAAGYSELA